MLIWVPTALASTLLLYNGFYISQLGQMAIAAICSAVQRPGEAVGVGGTVAAVAITANLLSCGNLGAIAGSSIWMCMTFVNWGHIFAYSPRFAHTLMDWTVTNYSEPPGELRGHLSDMSTSKTCYCFHPHGIATVGFSCNGCWNHEFHKYASLPDGLDARGRPEYRGTMFLLAASLREPSAIFKVFCDLSGRYQSASKRWMLKYMREGRNVAIIPGGLEDATLMQYGSEWPAPPHPHPTLPDPTPPDKSTHTRLKKRTQAVTGCRVHAAPLPAGLTHVPAALTPAPGACVAFSILFCPAEHRTAIKQRKGLVKYALQHGYKLTPIYTFGETKTYYTFSGLQQLRLWINKTGIPCVMFFGAWWNPTFMRTDAQCLSYVGKPLQLPTVPDPTKEQVDEWHAKYIAALQALFDERKAEAGEPDAVLEIM